MFQVKTKTITSNITSNGKVCASLWKKQFRNGHQDVLLLFR
jgi:hypothetical protein